METNGLIVVALCILGFGVISGRVQRSAITPPIVFVLAGMCVGSLFLGLVGFDVESHWINTLAELTLILVLFTDASRIDLRLLYREHDIPVRLLLIGLPLTIIAGAFAAAALFDALSFWEAAVLAAILAPTDAALGQAVVSSKLVPVRIRQALNVESGVNDGVVLPVLLILLASASAEHGETTGYWVRFTALQITLGPLVGIAVGYGGGKLVELGARSGWMNHAFQEISAIGLALLAYAGAELVGGNGFIAAFCAGLTIGNTSRAVCSCLYEFAEVEGQLLTLLIFMVFGVVMVPIAFEHIDGLVILYSLLSLTVLRVVPVIISLLGARLRWDTSLFLGWFGPRGIASILFALLVLEEGMLPGREDILVIVVTTVFLSVFVHGLTAYPGAKWYARRLGREAREEHPEEHRTVTEMPVRISMPEAGE